MKPRVIVVGGGWSGCAAALSAAKAGAEVSMFEKTDMLLGAGLVGGIMRNNGRHVATEELIAMGGGDLFRIADKNSRHRGIDFPGHQHANLYDVHRIEPAVLEHLTRAGVNIHLMERVVDVKRDRARILGVKTEHGQVMDGDVFVDATGTSGPMGNCTRYGNGCAMCVQRCPTFGPRVSIVARMGIHEAQAIKAPDVYGAMSGSCKIAKDSLAPAIQKVLDKTGVYIQKIPETLINRSKLSVKACQQYALPEYAESVVLLDTGHAKLMSPYFPLGDLRSLAGFERARYVDPYSGGRGNSIRFLALAPRNMFLQVEGVQNLFCGGEKAGVLVGHTEAIVTGTLAGHNAVRRALGMPLLGLPRSTATGEFVSESGKAMATEDGLRNSYTFAGSVFFEHMKEKGLYSTDPETIHERIQREGLTGVFKARLV